MVRGDRKTYSVNDHIVSVANFVHKRVGLDGYGGEHGGFGVLQQIFDRLHEGATEEFHLPDLVHD